MLRTSIFVFAAFLSLVPCGFGARPAEPAGTVDIPYRKFVLRNGLTLIVHEDHKTPVVAVNVWYHVGSKDEKRGRTGFAHLFEHLCFNGSEHFDDDYFKAVEKIGATDLNGSTNVDRTNYFQTVPASALDLVLFLESDRMGHLLGAIDQARLDEQRGVVQNEKRQGENQPYGVTRQILSECTYPAGHPYSWTTIGSMEDLGAASLEDAREWFRKYYGPNNAVVVVAGDVETEDARARVERFFGDLPPGPPIARPGKWIAKMAGTRRHSVEDRVPQARIYKVWNVPEWGSVEALRLEIAAGVLASGKSSRLHRRLVREEGIATDVSAQVWDKEIGSQFTVQATARPGGDLAAAEREIDEELARFLRDGPTDDEVERVRAGMLSGFVRGAERIGGFGGKSDILAFGEVFASDPGSYKARQAALAAVRPGEVREAAASWLSDGCFVLEVHPFPDLAAAGTGADRARLPDVPPPPAPRFPAVERRKLPNGLELVVCRRPGIPLVGLDLLIEAGRAADPAGAPGTAAMTLAMLDEGTSSRSAIEIAESLERLGASLSAGAGLDTCRVSLSTLKPNLDPALEIFAGVVLRPSFPAPELERRKERQIAAIRREKVSPTDMALRVLPGILYGPGHPYAQPLSGSGTEESIARLGREDLLRFHRSRFLPDGATLIAVGDIGMEELGPRIERLFESWKPGEAAARKEIPAVPAREERALYLIDRPGSEQSVIVAAGLVPPRADPDDIAFRAVHDLLGGSFTSRINLNLREDKHWTYGARTWLPDARGQRIFYATAPVQADRTREAIGEIAREMASMVGDRPISEAELAKAQGRLARTLPGRWETGREVAASLGEIAAFGLPLDFFEKYPGEVQALTVSSLNSAARRLVRPDRIVWVVVGDLARIEAGVRSLGLGPVRRIDADGRPAGAPAASGEKKI
jgi:zinc protease